MEIKEGKKRKSPFIELIITPKRLKPDVIHPLNDSMLGIFIQIQFLSWLSTYDLLFLPRVCKLFRDLMALQPPTFWFERLKRLHVERSEKLYRFSPAFDRFTKIIYISYLTYRCATCHHKKTNGKRYRYVQCIYAIAVNHRLN